MSVIRIESKNVTYNGQDTGYNHAYLLLDGNGTADGDDLQARGGAGTDGSIAIQFGQAIESSLDARGAVTPADRGDVLISSAGADGQWSLYGQLADQIAAAKIAYTYPTTGVAVQNSNSVVATLLHTVGLDIAQHLPANATMAALTGAETVLDFARDLTGGAGADMIVGWRQDDRLRGGDGNDTLDGDAGNNTLEGGAGGDAIRAGDGNNHIYGNAAATTQGTADGADAISVGAGSNYINGNAGNDTVTAGAAGSTGSNRIQGGGGDDALAVIGAGANSVNGNLGADTISAGGATGNLLRGGQGNDSLTAGAGQDVLMGDLGADTLVAGTGANHLTVMTGGADADVFRFAAGTATLPDPATTGGSQFYQEVTDFAPGTDRLALAITPGPGDLLVNSDGARFTDAVAARSYAQQLLDGHAGTNDVAAVQVGGDTLLFYNDAGGASVDALVKLDGVSAAGLALSDFA